MLKIKTNQNLLIVLVGQFLSEIGNKIYYLALTYWVLDTTKSSALTGIFIFSSMVPATILGYLLGGFVDRHNKKHIMMITDIISGSIIVIVSILHYANLLNLPFIIVSQILLSICGAYSGPAVFALMPVIVDLENLPKAIAKTHLIEGLATIIGPILGSLGLAYFGYGVIFIANAVSFFMSAILEQFIAIPHNINSSITDAKNANMPIIDGYRYILRKKLLISILIIVVICHFIVGALQIIMPILSQIIQGNGPKNLGMIQATFGIGAVVASLLLTKVKFNNHEEKLMFGSLGVVGLTYVAIGVADGLGINHIVPYLIIIFFIGSTIILASTCYQMVLQKNIENSMKGRIYGIVNSIGDSTIPLGTLICGLVLEKVQLYWTILIIGIIIIPIIIFLYLMGDRNET
jgi:hypothetical protein